MPPFDALPGDAPHVLWPGRLAEQKDPLLTLEVLRRLCDRGVTLTLHVVGDGPMAPEVRRRARELQVDGHIRWHPPSQDMPRWYASCDLMLMTSRFEGVPYVLYEALAMGVPAVAPALAGNVELMDADSGVLVSQRDDPCAYADAVEDLLSDRVRRTAMGRRSRERMRRHFSVAEMARRHEDLYAAQLVRRSAAARLRGLEVPTVRPMAPTPAPPPIRLARRPAPPRTVGVIVPCYEHGRFLPECIASVRAQTLPAARIVVVDDASEDPETRAALGVLDAEPGVQVLRLERNRGPSAARNRALAELDVSYVLPLDADDRLLPDALERMVGQLEQAPAGGGLRLPAPAALREPPRLRGDAGLQPVPAHRGNHCPATSLFDRRVFDAGIRYPEDVVFGHEDWDLVLQLGERGIQGEPADPSSIAGAGSAGSTAPMRFTG